VKLLRVLQEQEFEPVGSSRTVKVDVRIIAATNRNLEQEVAAGRFRADLFYRLNVLPIHVPPLRDRREDVTQLAMFFVQKHAKRIGRTVDSVSRESLDRLASYAWPGNVRELLGIVSTGYALSEGEAIHPHDFADRLDQAATPRDGDLDKLARRLQSPTADFWLLVHQPFLDRDLSRREVRKLVASGLRDAGGSYRRLLELWNLPAASYQKFMDFLRHQRLKPHGFGDEEA
jgi:transcriptional regulator with GAF, ATPase, and Fis domain